MFNEQVNTRTDHLYPAQNGEPEPTTDIAMRELGPPDIEAREQVLVDLLRQLDAVHPGATAPEVGLTHASHVCSGVQVFHYVQMAHGFGRFLSACVAGRGIYTNMTCSPNCFVLSPGGAWSATTGCVPLS